MIVEDDAELRACSSAASREEGFASESRRDRRAQLLERARGRRARRARRRHRPAGRRRARRSARRCARAASNAPVLFLTARDALPDRLAGLRAGGDDYLTKPFAFAGARRPPAGAAPARGRRLGGADGRPHGSTRPPTPRPAARTRVRSRRRSSGCSPLLARAPARPSRRRQLVQAGWPNGAIVHANTLDAYLARLRRKLRRARHHRTRDHDPRRRLLDSMSRLGIRGRLLGAAVASVIVTLCILVVGSNLVLGRRLASDTDSLLRARASAELSTMRIRNGAPVVTEAPDAGATTSPVWVFAGITPIERPRAPAAVDRGAKLMAREPAGMADVPGQETRLLSVAVVDHGRRVGTVVAAVSLDPYNDTRRIALLGSVLLAVAIAVVFAASTGWILRRALQPVARMTADAADWSEHDLDRRFQLGPPRDELTQLGATLDDLLARLAAGLRREQRLSTEISHELRTPLARIQAESDLALRRDRTSSEYTAALASIGHNARRMTEIIDTLMETARQEASPATATCDMHLAVQAAACGAVATAHAVTLELARSHGPARARVEQALAERILQPLLENACRHARTRVSVNVATVDTEVRVTVLDDGPGIAAADVGGGVRARCTGRGIGRCGARPPAGAAPRPRRER